MERRCRRYHYPPDRAVPCGSYLPSCKYDTNLLAGGGAHSMRAKRALPPRNIDRRKIKSSPVDSTQGIHRRASAIPDSGAGAIRKRSYYARFFLPSSSRIGLFLRLAIPIINDQIDESTKLLYLYLIDKLMQRSRMVFPNPNNIRTNLLSMFF